MADILVVGLSARALAAAARSGGYRPLAADLFDDLDLWEIAEASVRVDGDLETGFEREPLLGALEALAADRAPIGIIYGTGFEDRPDLIDRLAERWRVFGNPATAVTRAKDPAALAEICGRLAIPHPRWSSGPEGPDWLRKQRGGAGGAHVGGGAPIFPFSHREKVPAKRADEGVPRVEIGCEPGAAGSPSSVAFGDTFSLREKEAYWQERVPGEPVSALVLGCGSGALVLGLSEQWPDPAADAPFRYGGAVRPAALAPATAVAVESAAQRVAEGLRLVGLNSVDFLVDGESWNLIEVNPRPGATLDIFAQEGELFGLHVEACRGRMPATLPHFTGAAAAATVYARESVECVPELAWPDWTADRQKPGTRVEAGEPLCTVLARADDAGGARRIVGERADAMRAALARRCADG